MFWELMVGSLPLLVPKTSLTTPAVVLNRWVGFRNVPSFFLTGIAMGADGMSEGASASVGSGSEGEGPPTIDARLRVRGIR